MLLSVPLALQVELSSHICELVEKGLMREMRLAQRRRRPTDMQGIAGAIDAVIEQLCWEGDGFGCWGTESGNVYASDD
jgi:hypothetical protein